MLGVELSAVAVSPSEVAEPRIVSSGDIRLILDRLVSERQRLRLDVADAPTLEANRLAIVYWQARLARALAADHSA